MRHASIKGSVDIQKKRYIFIVIALFLLVTKFSTPSAMDYHDYLKNEHGLSDKVISSEYIRHLPIYMTAETNISYDENNKIRVLGMFNHFFVLENKLKLPADIPKKPGS
ncbi:hypothetical protein [Paenibacillus sp. LHD-38]|uniref:hypothetical protein n=1 Tax=Paenibacillus sp. LHD-38 TaxID=3072143 RepID=UPI00280F8BA0|nr:hypothetical protein [Paenibacillus sp. LHD-38]MDQ8735782.1 hypothetical protein [Paenibacillus sp. LHD-38]